MIVSVQPCSHHWVALLLLKIALPYTAPQKTTSLSHVERLTLLQYGHHNTKKCSLINKRPPFYAARKHCCVLDKSFLLWQGGMRKMFTGQTQAVQPTMHHHSGYWLRDRQTDGGSYSERSRGAMWSSCPHLDLVNRAACQNDHTWSPLFFCLCLSTQSLHPVRRKPVTPLHTHTHFLALIHAKEDGLNHGQESSHVHSSFFQSSCAPCRSNFLSAFQKSSCFLLFPVPSLLTKTWFIQ